MKFSVLAANLSDTFRECRTVIPNTREAWQVALVLGLVVLSQAEPASASTQVVQELLLKAVKFFKDVAVVAGWGLGFLYIVKAVVDFANSGEEYSLKRRAANHLAGGFCLVCAGQVIQMLCDYLGVGKI